jgi:hypothetical protein
MRENSFAIAGDDVLLESLNPDDGFDFMRG